jgi:DNA-binding transcriptional regulator YiaG
VNFTLVTRFYAVAANININMLRNWEVRQDRPTESAAARRKTRG